MSPVRPAISVYRDRVNPVKLRTTRYEPGHRSLVLVAPRHAQSLTSAVDDHLSSFALERLSKRPARPDTSLDAALDRHGPSCPCYQHGLRRPGSPSLVQERPGRTSILKDVLRALCAHVGTLEQLKTRSQGITIPTDVVFDSRLAHKFGSPCRYCIDKPFAAQTRPS